MTYLLHKIVSAKVLPERSKGGYGVLFAFSDGWVEACFHERRSQTPDTANRRERSCVDLCGSIEARNVTVMPMLRVPSWKRETLRVSTRAAVRP
jgi:hypothetical protein